MVEAAVEIPVQTEETKGVDVVVDDKTPKAEIGKIVSADEGIEDLKAQVEKAKKDSATRLAEKDRQIQEAFQRATAAERETVTVKRDAVGTILEKLGADKDAARRDLIAAHEAGDFAKVADAQDRLSMVNARIVEAEKGKMVLEDEVKNPQGRQVQDSVSDPVEVVARTMQSRRSADWIRQHPEAVVNGAVAPAAMSAHFSALDKGLEPDSDAYFEHLEGAIGGRRSESRQQERQQTGRDMNRSPTSAPVNRDVVQAPGATRPGSIRLEPHEVQTALDTYAPLYPKESRDQLLKRYAQDKMQLIDEGKISRRAS
jgi:hypothetical protein